MGGIYFAYLLGLVGWIWIIVIAIRQGHIVWGVLSLLLFIPAFIYGIVHWENAKVPFILLVAGSVLMFMAGSSISPEQAALLTN